MIWEGSFSAAFSSNMSVKFLYDLKSSFEHLDILLLNYEDIPIIQLEKESQRLFQVNQLE
ncbi:predicted protein [Histoplasma mississippiense (nom. inval.)]|uniref:predicted protein n=1 Tax=Ajellomyces capsulatus (strain NAm1 / WU24) TaxID=2059318 RepID=UPI000157D0F4|nr:predicted protein [Histoplasma mississippiense (nom. inval.)]EDN11273.1 predicted protein [Histoplasma mississippiense (nom. inval.)]